MPGLPSAEAAAREIVAALVARPPTLGDGRLLAVDGPAGSGKTTLAGAVEALTDARVVHLDDLYEGWSGLPRVPGQLDALMRPLTEGRPGSYRRYDWQAHRLAGTVTVAPAPLLVVEGVGAGSRSVADLVTLLVWVEADPSTRLARGLARDGEAMRPEWERWQVDEAAHFAAEATRERADLRFDGDAVPIVAP